MSAPWIIMIIGAPTAGKSRLARKLAEALPRSVRINPDELRMMLFDDEQPVHDEHVVYTSMVQIRNLALREGHSVIFDVTAPRMMTRQFLFGAAGRRTRRLIVLMDVSREVLAGRATAAEKLEILRAFERVWQEPGRAIPVFKFRNDNEDQFETSFYLLGEYMKHEHHEHEGTLRRILRLPRYGNTDNTPQAREGRRLLTGPP